MLDKIKGGLFGVAIGDAIGGTTEFMSADEIIKRHGRLTDMIGGGVWNLEPGETTDDTAMTMAVCEGIIINPEDPIPYIGESFLKWYDSKPKDIGNIVESVLRQYNGDWFQTSKKVCVQMDGMCAGNGTLMRTLPVSLAYPSLQKMLEITHLQSNMTHNDEETAYICQIYNKIAHRLLKMESINEAIEKEIDGSGFTSIYKKRPIVPPDGYVVNTFFWVLYYLYHIDDFQEIAFEAANNGGDSDTIAAIACGLKGVEVGFNRLPEDLKNKILVKAELNELSEKLYILRMRLEDNAI
nr:ADP-ribosylglycohydrolase family protein [Bacillus massilionigeriensis]